MTPKGAQRIYAEWRERYPGRGGADLDALVDALGRYRAAELSFERRKARRYRALAVSLLGQRRALVAQRDFLRKELDSEIDAHQGLLDRLNATLDANAERRP